MIEVYPSCSVNNPALLNAFKSPPASTTALTAAWLNLRRLSAASFSLLALVLELPEGATPLRILLLSCGVKLTKPTVSRLGGLRGVELVGFLRRWREARLDDASLRDLVPAGGGEGD